jgi:hypothetical protein
MVIADEIDDDRLLWMQLLPAEKLKSHVVLNCERAIAA